MGAQQDGGWEASMVKLLVNAYGRQQDGGSEYKDRTVESFHQTGRRSTHDVHSLPECF